MNVSKSGVRLSTSLRGTGISWSTTILGAAKRVERAERAYQRQLQTMQREYGKWVVAQQNAYQVAVFQNYVAMLTSMHRESWSEWNWWQIAATPPPPPPPRAQTNESEAVQALTSYQPSFLDQVLNSEARQREELSTPVDIARARDANEAAQREAHVAAELERWRWFYGIARGITAGDVDACAAALQYLGPFDELQAMGCSLEVGIDRPWCVQAWFGAKTPNVVPVEALSVTKTGKLSRKRVSAAQFWSLLSGSRLQCRQLRPSSIA